MGNVSKILSLITLFSLFICHSPGQVVRPFCIHNFSQSELDSIVLDFWRKSHNLYPDFPVKSITDLSFGINDNITPWILYESIDSHFADIFVDSSDVIRILSHTNTDIEQVILFHYGWMFLIEMRNPLPAIVAAIKKIENFSALFADRIINEVTRVHRGNWHIKNDVEFEIGHDVFDENFNDDNNNYRPDIWE
jgi:hypothetical protein